MYRSETVEAGARNRLIDRIPSTATQVLLVTGSTSFEESGIASVIGKLEVNIERFIAPSPNPELDCLRDGIQTCKQLDPDLVIGVGGGSVLDSAKAIAILSDQPREPRHYITGDCTLKRTGYPLVAIPTTAGTGSETTHFATIYVDGKKNSLVGKPVYPTTALVDPELLASVPNQVRATSGADVISQAIESYWSTQSTVVSRRLAGAALKLAWQNLETEALNPTPESRWAMAKAAHLAGKAIDISKTTACHSVSYPITSRFGVDHGAAVALTVPAFLKFNSKVSEGDCMDPRGSSFVGDRIKEIVDMLGGTSVKESTKKLTGLFERIGIPTNLSAANVTNTEVVLDEGFTPERMNNNPRKVTRNDLKEILASLK